LAALALLAIALGLSQFSWKGYVHTLMTLGMLLSTATMVWFFDGKTARQIFKLALKAKAS
jgi:hypothetical protein